MPRPGHPVPSAFRAPRVALGLRLLVLLVALTAAASACSLLPAASMPAIGDALLVTVERHGGECPQGECASRVDIHLDGRLVRSDGTVQVVDAAGIERLAREIGRADWDAILAVPFTGECPTAYDGQEVRYTFHVAPAPVTVASCTTAIDPDAEPFRSVSAIVDGSGEPVPAG